MKRLQACGISILSIIALQSCSSQEGPPDKEVSAAYLQCVDILGKKGISWVKRSAGGDSLTFSGRHSFKEAKQLIYSQVRAWTPEHTFSGFVAADVCTIRKDDKPPPPDEIRIRFDRSYRSFEGIQSSDDSRVLRVKSGVVLEVDSKGAEKSGNDYAVYFKCQIPGARSDQLESVPLAAKMKDSLNSDQSSRRHFKYLLGSARVMSETLKCENSPEIPLTVPPLPW